MHYQGSIYVLVFCNDAEYGFCENKPEYQCRIFKSDDADKTFYEHCIVPFPDTIGRGYGNMVFTSEEKLIVYEYNLNDQQYIDYAVSSDCGRTGIKPDNPLWQRKYEIRRWVFWTDNIFYAEELVNQRQGMAVFALYTSRDGLTWDEGAYIN